MHHLKSKVRSVIQLKASIIEEFEGDVPTTLDFDLGWFEGNTKRWLVVSEDLAMMYSKCTSTEISLWCDVSETKKRKRGESSVSQRDEGETVDIIFQNLSKQHKDYTKPQLKLWARMIHCGSHDNYEEPPDVPLITGIVPKRQKKNPLSDAFTDAARAVSQAFSPDRTELPARSSSSLQVGISPGKAVDLRRKNFEQLRYAQNLYDDKVLSLAEYTEQKETILDALKKLNN